MNHRKIKILMISTLLSLVGVEIYIRASKLWVETDRIDFLSPSEIDGLPYSHKKNQKTYWSGFVIRTNSLGLMDEVDPQDIRFDCERVLVLGGSFTAGHGGHYQDSYPRQLEKLLNREKCFQVINAGVLGYVAQDISTLLTHLMPIYKPNFIIYAVNQFAMNDSLSVDENGFLLPGGVRYEWFEETWRPYETIDLYNVQSRPLQETKNPAWCYSCRYLQKKLLTPFLKPTKPCDSTNCLPLSMSYAITQGDSDQFGRYSPLYFAPTYRKRLYENLKNAVVAAGSTPLLFFTINFFIETEFAANHQNVFFTDLAQVTGIRNTDFLKTHNLLWDFHFDRKGKRQIAKGLANWVRTHYKLQPRESSKYSYNRTLQSKRKQIDRYMSFFSSEIDIDRKKNIHQIFSGLGQDGRHGTSEIHLLLKGDKGKELVITGKVDDEVSNIQIEISGMEENYQHQLKHGHFRISHFIPLRKNLYELTLRCLDTNCSSIKYRTIGFSN